MYIYIYIYIYRVNTTHNNTKNHPPHITTIEGGAATVRTTVVWYEG